ncbi:MAG: sulfatase [Planctomycetes bacterium]|nr:sulfatase [Planctomycetota bacterium]
MTAILSAVLAPAGAAETKNVVLLISDNQTWFDVGCYGNRVVQTPNIDRLATEGVRFESAFATTASCGPSRAVIYSGLLTHRNGQYAHPHREHNQEIRPDVTTVFAMLKENGYRTGLIGKDHVRPLEKYPIDFKPRTKSRDVLAMAAMADTFIRESKQPFFLVMSFGDPHPVSIDGPGWGIPTTQDGYSPIKYDPHEISVPKFLPDTPEVREGIAGYYQQTTRMDDGVGRVLESIEKHGHKNDTLVIFTADHGTSEPGAMGTHYEPGVRVPFVVRSPGLKKKSIVNPALVAFTDITPTILDWTDTTFDDYKFHGRSFLPILESDQTNGWDRALLSHVGHDVFAYYPMRTLRGRRYKLIWNVNYRSEYPLPIDTVQRRTWVDARQSDGQMLGGRSIEAFLHRPQLELYDLQSDPWETTNLAERPDAKSIRTQMVAELVERLEAQQDPWLRNYHPLKAGQ